MFERDFSAVSDSMRRCGAVCETAELAGIGANNAWERKTEKGNNPAFFLAALLLESRQILLAQVLKKLITSGSNPVCNVLFGKQPLQKFKNQLDRIVGVCSNRKFGER